MPFRLELVAHGSAMVLEEREVAVASCCLAGADGTDQRFLAARAVALCQFLDRLFFGRNFLQISAVSPLKLHLTALALDGGVIINMLLPYLNRPQSKLGGHLVSHCSLIQSRRLQVSFSDAARSHRHASSRID